MHLPLVERLSGASHKMAEDGSTVELPGRCQNGGRKKGR